MLHAADVARDPLRLFGKQEAEGRHGGYEDRGAGCLSDGKAHDRDAEGASRQEGDDSEAQHETGREHRSRTVPLDHATDGIETGGAEQTGEYGMGDDAAPVAPADEINGPVGTGDAQEPDHDHVTQVEHVLAREHARGQQGQVLGQRQSDAAPDQEEEEPEQRRFPGQAAVILGGLTGGKAPPCLDGPGWGT